MGALTKLIGSPITGLIDSVGGLLDRVVTNPNEKLEVQRELIRLETEFRVKVMEADQKWAETQASVVKAEVESKSWMARNWRPVLMLTFTYIIAHTFILVPIFGIPSVEIPADMWDLLKLGMGGYIVGRSAEKVVPAVAETLKKR